MLVKKVHLCVQILKHSRIIVEITPRAIYIQKIFIISFLKTFLLGQWLIIVVISSLGLFSFISSSRVDCEIFVASLGTPYISEFNLLFSRLICVKKLKYKFHSENSSFRYLLLLLISCLSVFKSKT